MGTFEGGFHGGSGLCGQGTQCVVPWHQGIHQQV
uniref:Uncharacterized protein n=1 Tax=Arundo donax TaxID=35708 RepID=A0A0A9ERM5_ARUDO